MHLLTSSILSADIGDANTTLIYTGRPLRVRQTDYVKEWNERHDEIKKLTSEGKIPHDVELQAHPEKSMPGKSWLMGDVSALIKVRLCPLARRRGDTACAEKCGTATSWGKQDIVTEYSAALLRV